jgi:DNA-binding NarL/FixJ family response regulator
MTDDREIGLEDLQVLRLLATGLSLESVARRLELSERTVRRRTRALCDRLGVGTPIEAIVWAAQRGLL